MPEDEGDRGESYFRRMADRAMNGRLDRMQHELDKMDVKLDSLSVRVAVIAALLGLVIIGAQIIGPVIAQFIIEQ